MNDLAAQVRRHSRRWLRGCFSGRPGGTQVPQAVIDAVASYYREATPTARRFDFSGGSDAIVAAGAGPWPTFLERPVGGRDRLRGNMTTLTFHLARTLGRRCAGRRGGWSRAGTMTQHRPPGSISRSGRRHPWLEFRPARLTRPRAPLGG